ncbi:MAG TPA: PHB depolymerase family esterase [Pseudolysinimonas sp.]|nr:PHB depolymerase family esterase [Pseudolysinimonas sp.]
MVTSRSHRARLVTTLLNVTVIALLLSACGLATGPAPAPSATAPVYPTGTSSHRMSFDGAERTYLIHVPEGLPSTSHELVVMMHGGFGSALQAEKSYNWDAAADEGGFIVAYPDGLGRAWNAGECCGKSARNKVDDVGFIEAMVSEISAGLDIAENRIFATGISNGGIMAYRLACETDTFAAIAPVAATMLVPCDNPSPISVLHIHGLQDTSVPYDGSVGTGAETIDGPPVDDVLAFWRGIDGCGRVVTTAAGDPRVQDTYPVAECTRFTTVESITIADAGHQWPGAKSSELRDNLGGVPPSTLLDATSTIAGFFAGHPRPMK